MATKTRERLTRERVVEAALKVLDAEGLEAVSMRRVAREVGVEAMSLYNHVRDKDDLLEGILERILRAFPEPTGDPVEDWAAYGRDVARAWRTVLKAHPHALPLLAERKAPPTDPEVLVPMETALRTLRQAGLSDRDAVQAFHAIGGYIFGFVMMETGQLYGGPDTGSFPPTFVTAFPAERLPCVAAALPYLTHCDFDEQFEFGLDLMLEGLRAKIAAPAG
ncbi:MAG: TetR/AcrR family transcriptional regulator C-terminal domain-containing protein [Planctomycetaceae bacterium]